MNVVLGSELLRSGGMGEVGVVYRKEKRCADRRECRLSSPSPKEGEGMLRELPHDEERSERRRYFVGRV